MPSKTLYGVWAFLDFMLLTAGGLSIAFSVLWRAPDALRNLIISDLDLTVGLVLGIALVVAFVISIAAVVQPNHVTLPLTLFNYLLVLVGIICVVVGSTVWFWTLREASNFHSAWVTLAPAQQGAIQDLLSCCGYANFTDTMNSPQGFCVNVATRNLTSPQPIQGCQGPIVSFGDMTLNNIFTTIYGFMAIVGCLSLATLCVINKRLQTERFRKIDAKRGGRGFV